MVIEDKDVYLTASFADDYLHIEVVHIKSMNDQEQQTDYEEQFSKWEKLQASRKEEELRRIEQDMASLKRQQARLKGNE